MAKILIPAQHPEDWKQFLAEPEKQWRAGYSAKALADCWQRTPGFPPEVEQLLKTSLAFRDVEMLYGIPELQTPLPGGARPSQTDLWVLARTSDGLVSIAVEGKVSEPFGDLVADWIEPATPGKQKRLAYLCELLGLMESDALPLRYQLLHRTASAVLEARRLFAPYAVMLVHTFSQRDEWHEDFEMFAAAMGAEVRASQLALVGPRQGIELYVGWVTGKII